MSNSYAIPHHSARTLPGGTKRPDRAPDGLTGVRENVPDEVDPITYATRVDGSCVIVLAGVRCPSRFAHAGACGARMRSETGLDFYVTWEPVDAHLAHAADDPKQLRVRVGELERDNGLLWRLAVCRVCGTTADNIAERKKFLTSGAHDLCLADETRDVEECSA